MHVSNDILVPELIRLLQAGKEVRFTPSGVSMRPFIEGDRDSVIVAPFINPKHPKIGDIVLAETSLPDGQKNYVLHRIIRVQKDGIFVLQGDGNLTGEEHCDRSQIYGFVRRIESLSGHPKPLTHGCLWHLLKPIRKWLLKFYRHFFVRKEK